MMRLRGRKHGIHMGEGTEREGMTETERGGKRERQRETERERERERVELN